jgi:ribonuclease R
MTDEGFPLPGATPRDDTASVMRFYGLKHGFPKAVRDEAKRVALVPPPEAPQVKRLDLRRKFIFTCDPVTARDYDDALSLERDRLGRRRLGVHIADVSHYVRPGSALDKEAYRRSTSVYLASCVIPMLPEELSNGLCSLVPGEDRLAFSVFLTFNREGEVVKREFAKSVIRSKARFTYEQVLGVIQGAAVKSVTRQEAKTIRAIHELAQQLRAKRFAAGALDLEIPEIEVTLDEDGMMSGLVARDYDESHQMIEECMVAANEAVAATLWMQGVKILARRHDAPDPEKLRELRQEVRALGITCGNLENPRVFAQFLQTIKRSPIYPTLAVMVLRSMKRAVYDAGTMGHWGLAKRFYAHFTSPIRRYPDLTLHRQLAAYLAAGRQGVQAARVDAATLAKWAAHTSEMEERAAEAERALVEIKKYRLLDEELASHIKVEYEAVIAKCERFGCFVDVPSIGVSGLVHISQLSRKYVRYNESDHSLSAPGGGRWRVGDRLKVVVEKVDFENRRIDFIPCSRSRCHS